jgi:hypothetical protein
MKWTSEIRQFVTDHLMDDTARLLLSAHRFPQIDVPFAVEQIEARRRLRNKLPEWYAESDLVMGGRIPAEQCSSESTARFKRTVMLPDARSLCDMTGGMGVDFWYMSRKLERAIYTECQPHLCAAARHNFQVLSAKEEGPTTRIEVREGLSTELPIPAVDVIYLDPARRSDSGSRIFEVSDCLPDVVAWQDDLLMHCRQLITKLSPMADITRTVSRLKQVSDVYVLSVKGECKELLFVQLAAANPLEVARRYAVHCLDFYPERTIEFNFDKKEGEEGLSSKDSKPFASSLGPFFYEPDVSVMKAQGFRALLSTYDIRMLDTDCHYFTSSTLIPDFPGRIFAIDEQFDFASRSLKTLRHRIPQANVSVRNFPLTADELRSRAGIRDGGDVYLFGARLNAAGPILIRCHKINTSLQ